MIFLLKLIYWFLFVKIFESGYSECWIGISQVSQCDSYGVWFAISKKYKHIDDVPTYFWNNGNACPLLTFLKS